MKYDILRQRTMMKMVKGTYVRILDEEMKRLIDNGIKMEG